MESYDDLHLSHCKWRINKLINIQEHSNVSSVSSFIDLICVIYFSNNVT